MRVLAVRGTQGQGNLSLPEEVSEGLQKETFEREGLLAKNKEH